MQRAAKILMASSGGSHSGKKGLHAYVEKVKATMVMVQGLTTRHSAHSLIKPTKPPKVSKM